MHWAACHTGCTAPGVTAATALAQARWCGPVPATTCAPLALPPPPPPPPPPRPPPQGAPGGGPPPTPPKHPPPRGGGPPGGGGGRARARAGGGAAQPAGQAAQSMAWGGTVLAVRAACTAPAPAPPLWGAARFTRPARPPHPGGGPGGAAPPPPPPGARGWLSGHPPEGGGGTRASAHPAGTRTRAPSCHSGSAGGGAGAATPAAGATRCGPGTAANRPPPPVDPGWGGLSRDWPPAQGRFAGPPARDRSHFPPLVDPPPRARVPAPLKLVPPLPVPPSKKLATGRAPTVGSPGGHG
jgi:hypothetical protein